MKGLACCACAADVAAIAAVGNEFDSIAGKVDSL